MLRHLIATADGTRATLAVLYSARAPEELAFRDELERLARRGLIAAAPRRHGPGPHHLGRARGAGSRLRPWSARCRPIKRCAICAARPPWSRTSRRCCASSASRRARCGRKNGEPLPATLPLARPRLDGGARRRHRPLHLARRAALGRVRRAARCRSPTCRRRCRPAPGAALRPARRAARRRRLRASASSIASAPSRPTSSSSPATSPSRYQRIAAQAARVYGHAPHGRLATLGIFGNHDYGPGWRHPEIAAALVPVLADAGSACCATRRSTSPASTSSASTTGGRSSSSRPTALAYRDATRPGIVLSHNPGYRGSPGLGRLRRLDPERPHPRRPVQAAVPAAAADSGAQQALHQAARSRSAGRRRLYISRGVGHTMMVRFNVRPEVTVVHAAARVSARRLYIPITW